MCGSEGHLCFSRGDQALPTDVGTKLANSGAIHWSTRPSGEGERGSGGRGDEKRGGQPRRDSGRGLILLVAEDLAESRVPEVTGGRDCSAHATLHGPGTTSSFYHPGIETKINQGWRSELELGAGPHGCGRLHFGENAWTQEFGMVCAIDRMSHEGGEWVLSSCVQRGEHPPGSRWFSC